MNLFITNNTLSIYWTVELETILQMQYNRKLNIKDVDHMIKIIEF